MVECFCDMNAYVLTGLCECEEDCVCECEVCGCNPHGLNPEIGLWYADPVESPVCACGGNCSCERTYDDN